VFAAKTDESLGYFKFPTYKFSDILCYEPQASISSS
jgi:hypothetical protein